MYIVPTIIAKYCVYVYAAYWRVGIPVANNRNTHLERERTIGAHKEAVIRFQPISGRLRGFSLFLLLLHILKGEQKREWTG